MKLYATTTSERASKGQGGDYLEIAITEESKQPLWQVSVLDDEEDYIIRVWNEQHNKFMENRVQKIMVEHTKAEKKKAKWQDIDITTGELIDRHN